MESYNPLKHMHLIASLVEIYLFFNEQQLYFYNLKNASLNHPVILFLRFSQAIYISPFTAIMKHLRQANFAKKGHLVSSVWENEKSKTGWPKGAPTGA